ncbi:MAG: circadian clock KaiB family protein [Spirulinaceae cyanobacterium]
MNRPDPTPHPDEFKGIALFTPAGDVIYAIDAQKQGRWHLHLCSALQTLLDLPEPPHFLVPAYTATLDRWRDPRTDRLHTYAELHPPLRSYPALLNALFKTPEQVWAEIPWHRSTTDPLLIEQYRETFASLWETHAGIWNYTDWQSGQQTLPTYSRSALTPNTTHYFLRVFVSGNNHISEVHLQQLHQLLETHFTRPYTLTVVDILKNPELAEADQITATPTLMRLSPLPMRRIVGTIRDATQLLELLLA